MKTVIPYNAATSAITSNMRKSTKLTFENTYVTYYQGLNVIVRAMVVANIFERAGLHPGPNSTRAITLGCTREQSPSTVNKDLNLKSPVLQARVAPACGGGDRRR